MFVYYSLNSHWYSCLCIIHWIHTDIHVCVLFTEFTLIFMFVYYSLNSHWYLCLCIIHWIHTDIHVCVLFIEFTLIIMCVCYSLNSDWFSCFSIICWIQTDIHVCVLFTEFIDIHVFKNIIHWIQTDINVCLLTDIHGFFLLFIEFTLIFMFLYYSLNSQWYSCFWGGFSIIHWIQTGVHVFVLQLFTVFTLIFVFFYYSLNSHWYSCLCIIHWIHTDIHVLYYSLNSHWYSCLYYSLNSHWYSCFWGGFSIIHWIQTGVHVLYYSLNSHWYSCFCIIHCIHTDIRVFLLFTEFTLIFMFVYYSLNSHWYSCLCIIHWIHTDIRVFVLFTVFTLIFVSVPGSGCADGTRDGLEGHERVAACMGRWGGHIANGSLLCAPGWRVCSWYDQHYLQHIKWNEAISMAGCYAYNAAQDGGRCRECRDDLEQVRGQTLQQVFSADF